MLSARATAALTDPSAGFVGPRPVESLDQLVPPSFGLASADTTEDELDRAVERVFHVYGANLTAFMAAYKERAERLVRDEDSEQR